MIDNIVENNIETSSDTLVQKIKQAAKAYDSFDYLGETITVKTVLSFAEVVGFVSFVVESCFDENGEYLSYVKDFAYKTACINYYTDVKLPDDIQERFSILYLSGLSYRVEKKVYATQLEYIKSAIDEAVDYKIRMSSSLIQSQLSRVSAQISDLGDKLNSAFGDIDQEALKNAMATLAENKIIHSAGAVKTRRHGGDSE